MLMHITLSDGAKMVYGNAIVSYPNKIVVAKGKMLKNGKSLLDTIIGVGNISHSPGKIILATGRKMALDDKSIIIGSCWNWVNAVFNRSGFGTSKQIVYKSRLNGPYADLSLIKPGDWLYYINYSYRAVQHSGIFVYWKDFEKKQAVVLSYSGRNRKVPGRYATYDLKHVYYITRAVEK